MDSLSQMALGATVSYAVLGPTMGKRALLIGAAVGTLPDLDVLVPYADAVASFTYHRSWSHSIFVLSLLSWPIAWLLRKVTSPSTASAKQWWLAIWLILITHPLLDGFTIYGTQIFWPLPLVPVAIGSIFIIDPLYTVPLLVACIIAWKRPFANAYRSVYVGLALSTFYLAWTVTAQYWTEKQVAQKLREASIDVHRLVVAPFPTSLLWRTVAINDRNYYETFTSLLDDQQLPLTIMPFDNGRTSCIDAKESWAVKRMDWFTQGAIALSRNKDELIVTDLRMGIEDNYVFRFSVGEWREGLYSDTISGLKPLQFDTARVSSLVNRITDSKVTVTSQQKDPQQGCKLTVAN